MKLPVAVVIRIEPGGTGRDFAYVACPYCHREHVHGAPDHGENAQRRRRVSHCHRGDYVIGIRPPKPRELHTLYRFFDQDGLLLYVGITCNPGVRFNAHRLTKTWWGDVASITLEKFSTRAELVAAESAAIIAERPLHNIAGTVVM